MRLAYLTKEGFRNMWANRLMALAAVGVLVCCLLLTGFSYLVFASSDQIVANVQQENIILVFMEQDQTDQQVAEIGVTLRNMEHVAEVEFLSKEDYLQQFGGVVQENTLESYQGEENPLPDTYIVSLVRQAIEDQSLYRQMLDKLGALPGVEDIKYDDGTAQFTTQLGNIVMAVGSVVVGVLLIVSLFIIVNTIKLTVYNRRLEIYIMKSVGATDNFIRFPFVVEGWLMGLLAGSISYGLMALLYKPLYAMFDKLGSTTFRLAPFSDHWVVLLVGFLGGGMLVGIIGSMISIRKHLHQEGGLRQ